MSKTKIEWTHPPGYQGESWNPVVGCSIVSKGCTNCYAMKFANRILDGNPKSPHYTGTTTVKNGSAIWTGKVARASEKSLTSPIRATKPRCYFVNSMGDLFAEEVPDEWIDQVFAVMALAPWHLFLILTKRPDRMRQYINVNCGRIADVVMSLRRTPDARRKGQGPSAVVPLPHVTPGRAWWPLPNVWLGTSVEDQSSADERIPQLLATPAAKRFISAEPLLGFVDLRNWIGVGKHVGASTYRPVDGFERCDLTANTGRLHWVIAGGESGPGARPMRPDWARGLRDQCHVAAVPFFFKQMTKKAPIPEEFQIREFPRCLEAHKETSHDQ